jgi:hypothetical protein
LLEFFKTHHFLNEIQMVETKLRVIQHPMSTPILTTIQKRKRTSKLTTVSVNENEERSQSLEKHRKIH